MLKDKKPIASSPEHVKGPTSGRQAPRAVRDGNVAAANVEPWISVAQKWGLRILIESHSTRSGPRATNSTVRRSPGCSARRPERSSCSRMTRRRSCTGERRAARSNRRLQTWRLLHAAPQPYTRERFQDTYQWTVKWNMTVPARPTRTPSTTGVGVARATSPPGQRVVRDHQRGHHLDHGDRAGARTGRGDALEVVSAWRMSTVCCSRMVAVGQRDAE